MIDSIECVIMDFSNLKTEEEIANYIPNQLGKHFPEPELLAYDYVITGTGNNRKALVSYTLKDNIKNSPYSDLKHPHLLFKYLLKKNGHYVIVYGGRILEVFIENKIITTINHLYKKDIQTLKLQEKTTLIADNKNMSDCKSIYNGKILSIEILYKKCKKDLFNSKKNKFKFKYLLLIVPTLGIIYFLLVFTFNFRDSSEILKTLKLEYNNLIKKDMEYSDSEILHTELIQKINVIESQLTPDLYTLFYNLNEYGDNYKIMDLTYTNRFLRVNAISKNSIKLIKDLNREDSFNFKQNTTMTKEEYEQFSFSGEILCP